MSQYSPNDTSKAFDRQVNRRSNVKFNPRQTIEILKLGEPSKDLDDDQKLDIVKKYMEVRISNDLGYACLNNMKMNVLLNRNFFAVPYASMTSIFARLIFGMVHSFG